MDPAFDPSPDDASRPPTITELDEPWSASPEHALRVTVGACRLRVLRAGEASGWVHVRYSDPTGTLPLSVQREYGSLRISQHARLSEVRRARAGVPELVVSLSDERAMALTIDSGASDVDVDLGGLALTKVTLKVGAGSVHVGCSAPTRQLAGGLARLEVDTGAASVSLHDLADAGPDQLVVIGGASSYDLSFGGTLRQDLHARVSTAGASVSLAVPATTPARVGVVSVLSGFSVDEGLQAWEDSYWTQPGVDGGRPMLSVDTSITLGSLSLTTT
jgi:hypothetical protein